MIKCKSVDVTDELLNKLNKFTRREHTADEVYVFSVILCDNDVDRDGECFTKDSLNKLKDLFVGKTGVFDHNPSTANQNARIFDTECITDTERKTAYGDDYTYLKALAYMIKTDKNADLIREIEGGIKKEVSISCSVNRQTCSVCGADLRKNPCEHRKGKTYSGKTCYVILDEPTDAYEWSFVAIPAQKNAGVIKAFDGENAAEKIMKAEKGVSLSAIQVNELKEKLMHYEKTKAEARSYRGELESDILKLAFLTSPYVPSEILLSAIKGLDIDKLKALRESYKSATREPSVQIAKPKETDNSNFIV